MDLNKYNIGIIGNGFVGGAIANGFKQHNIKIYDVEAARRTHSLKKTVEDSDYIFICVPTPADLLSNGEIDLSILDDVFEKISHLQHLENKIFIIKSTAIPGTTDKYSEQYPALNIVFNPEFLTERTANDDFLYPSRIVLGGATSSCNAVEKLYRILFPEVSFLKTTAVTAEFIKYFCNCFYAIKVSAFNEFNQIANTIGADWEMALEGLLSSGWVNEMHTKVPGPDGHHGFGGKCFPKDLHAFTIFVEKNNVRPVILKAAWQKNLEVRKCHEWLKIRGATSYKGEHDG